MDLSSNNIKDLPMNQIHSLELLNTLVLYENPFSSDKKKKFAVKLKDKIYNRIFD